MESIENREQFRQATQQLLQRIEEKINDLSRSGYSSQQAQNENTNQEIARLQTQRDHLKEALDRYGNESAQNWQKVKPEAQYVLEEVENTWLAGTPPAWSKPQNENKQKDSQWRVSTGQSDRGADADSIGLGDRAGMEDPQTGLDNDSQYSSFGNPYNNTNADADQNTNQGASKDSSTTSYEQVKASDRKRQTESEEEEGLSETNRGGAATQDDPGGSTDKGDRESNYNTPRTREKDKEESRNRPWDSRAM